MFTRVALHRFIDPEADAASQKAGSFGAPRYYGARQARTERDRALKRLQLGHAQEQPHSKLQKGPVKLALPLPGFIPLDESESKVNVLASLVAEALSMQMLLFYDFNEECAEYVGRGTQYIQKICMHGILACSSYSIDVFYILECS